jgi:hypothetical protein
LSENPLLPHRKLRELHALMLRCRELERKQKNKDSAREALLAATTMQLLPGDLLSARTGDLTAAQLAPQGKPFAEEKKPRAAATMPPVPSLPQRLALCTAAARGLQAAGTDGLVLSFTDAGATEPGWQAALEWAHAAQLPLLLACSDALGNRTPRTSVAKKTDPPLTFDAISRFASRIKLPVLTVDGEDAVAVYRVMQESVLRARMGGGPAVLWAIMSPAARLTRSSQPIPRLAAYLAARKISLRA